jgi:hypothetical protein
MRTSTCKPIADRMSSTWPDGRFTEITEITRKIPCFLRGLGVLGPEVLAANFRPYAPSSGVRRPENGIAASVVILSATL